MMTTNQTICLDNRVDREAMRWVADFDGLSISEQAEFERWIEQSDLHRTKFEIAKKHWQSLDVFKQLQQDPETQSEFKAMEASARSARSRRYTLITAAAATVAAVAFSFFWQLRFDHDAVHTTPIGERLTVNLPDDSTVLLNTNTRVAVSYTKEGRAVHLEHGEAHFEVAHDPTRPFLVIAGSGIVRAVGTAFNVYVHEDQVEVTVTDGEVEISQRPELLSDSVPIAGLLENNDSPVNRLTEGHNAKITHTIEAVAVVDSEALERKLAWQQGWLEFVNMPLGEVIHELDRYTVNKLEITDPVLDMHRVTVTGKASDIDGLLKLLDDSSDAINVVDNANGRVTISASLSR